MAAVALLLAIVLRAPLGQPAAVAAATVLFIGGGLPHGAYDIALLRRSVALDRYGLVMAIGGYVAIATLMAIVWFTLPLIALILFLAVAAVHFGEDWQILDEMFLRFAAGAAVIAAPTIGHPVDVAALFVAMSDERATLIAQLITAAAPVTLLVTAVGIAIAWRDGSRQWAAAMTLCLVLLVILPPVAGFALFFVFLHAPRHLAQTRAELGDMTLARWFVTGALLSGAAIVGWWGLQKLAPSHIDKTMASQGFQLLASVAVPHLLLSQWLEKRLDRPDLSQPTRSHTKDRAPMTRPMAIVIGSGIGGLACAIRLQSLGFDTRIVEQLDDVGGRAYVRRAQGFTFDMGPTVLTVPHFIEELFSLECGHAMLGQPDFSPEALADGQRIRAGISGGRHTSRYVDIVPVLPFYRIYFDDGTVFDYDADPVNVRAQIARLAPEDLDGYERFHEAARAIFQRGFLQLGYTYFGSLGSMLGVVPDLLKLGAVQPLFSLVSKYFKSDKMRQVFSFEPLLIGGNPLKVPAIYAMIHFVEKTWGVHFAMGGTGALVGALVQKFEELGGSVRLNAEVRRIDVQKRGRQRLATGVTLASGERLVADLVVSNADYATTYLRLIDQMHRRINSDALVKFRKQSMSLMVIYFGYAMRGGDPDLRHHNIILGPRYEALLTDIFEKKVLAEDFSQYLHIPTMTDPSLAPPGHHAAYTLIPVPNNLSDIDWDMMGERFADRVLNFLDDRGYIPKLRERLVYRSFVTPDYFEQTLGAYAGNGFGVEPRLTQTAFFRPHNRSEDITNLYLVGQGTQPGGGTPSVMMSAKMTAREIARDFKIDRRIVDGTPGS